MFTAYVENIGNIEEFDNLADAQESVMVTIEKSNRANNYGYVIEQNGSYSEVVWEFGHPSHDCWSNYNDFIIY